MDESKGRMSYRLHDALRWSGFACRRRNSVFGIASLFILLLAAVLPSIAAADTNKQINGPVTLPVIPVTAPRYAPIDWTLFNDLNNWDAPQYQSMRGLNGVDRNSPNNHTATTKKNKNKVKCQGYASDPVEVDDGAKLLSIPLFALPGEMGLKYTLYYHSETGSGVDNYEPWLSSVDYLLDTDCGFTNPNIACNQVTLYRPDGSSVSFSGSHASYGNFPEIGGGGLATLIHNSDGTWTLHDEDTTIQTYESDGSLTSIKDVSGIGWTISRTYTYPRSNATKITTVVTHTDGQSFTVVSVTNYNTTWASQTVTVTDPAGNQYTYSAEGSPSKSGIWVFDIESLSLPGTPATTISFTGGATLLTGVAYNGTAYWTTSYNSNNEVSSDGAADGTERTSIVYSTSSGGMVATITNPLGMTTTNTYTTDTQGNYLLASVSNSVVQGCGSTTNSLAWDGNDNLTKTVDNDGIAHTYSYAASGQLQTETEASGTAVARTINYTWDPNLQLNRLLSVTVPGESKVSYAYNAQNRLASVTRTNLTGIGTPSQPLTTSYAYTLYSNGMVEMMTVTQPSPSGSDHTTYVYDTHGNLTSITDGLGHATAYSNYNALDEVGKIVGPNGDETDYTYDARGRVATKTTHPNGGTAAWTYAYDGFGLLSQVSAPDGEITTWSRDAEKRVKTVTHNDKDGASTETLGYDANGDVTSDVIARGSDVGKSTSYVYNALGKIYQVKGSHGQVLTYGYDGNGNVLSVTDALGHKTSHAYDALNRLASTTDAAGGVTSYTYDAGDHFVHVTDPRGLVTGYAWDGLGQLWQQQSPDTGTTNYGYDAYGRLSSFIRADGTQTYLAYDSLNRLTSKTAGGVTRAYTWDVCTNGKGRLCAATTSGADSVGYSYSPEGWVTGRSFSISGGPTYGLGYAYDNMGHLAAVDYPDGNQALYDYTDGAVADVRMKVGTYNITGVSSITYRPMDLAMSNWTSYNGLTNAITYDSDLRPMSITVPNVESLGFTYDAADRITQTANGINGSLTQNLGYDALNRLTSVSSGADNETYQYDAAGNRTYQVINGTATNFSVAATSNHLNSVSGGYNDSYGYDADGDMTTLNGGPWWQYGPFDRLVSVGGMSYEYSAEGERIRKSGAPGTTYFAPAAAGTLMAEYDPNGIWLDYIWLNGRLVTVVTSNGGVYPVHDDQTRRPIAMTNLGNQSVIWAAQNLPFTTNVTTTTWFNFNIRFPGQYYDSEDEVSYNGNRDYSEALGRYIESDPIGLGGGVNTYAYVDNNPISNVDPLGLCDQQKCAQASSVVAAIGQQISSAGSAASWTGIGLIGASAVAAFFAPEGAPAELDAGGYGVGLIETGGYVSSIGAALQGYARDGAVGALEDGIGTAMVGFVNKAYAGWLFNGASHVGIGGMAGLLDKATEAVQAEAAACTGH